MTKPSLRVGAALLGFALVPIGIARGQQPTTPASTVASSAPSAAAPSAPAPQSAAAPSAPAPQSSAAPSASSAPPVAPPGSVAPPAPSASTQRLIVPPPNGDGGIAFGAVGKRYTSWDANLEGSYGRIFSDPAKADGFLRARIGVLWIRDPRFFSLGLTYEWSPISAATVGVQGEFLNLEVGLWGQVGALVDVAHGAKPGAMAAFGFSLVGVEVQVRDYEGLGFAPAVYGKLRIPLGIIGFGMRGR